VGLRIPRPRLTLLDIAFAVLIFAGLMGVLIEWPNDLYPDLMARTRPALWLIASIGEAGAVAILSFARKPGTRLVLLAFLGAGLAVAYGRIGSANAYLTDYADRMAPSAGWVLSGLILGGLVLNLRDAIRRESQKPHESP
jgi:hypothetical protein